MIKSMNSRRLQPKRLHNFYKSDLWHKVREEVILRAGRCEVCGKPGTEVHHKIHLTLDNLDDQSISLNPDNLLLLCKDCHNKMHGRFNAKIQKYKWNEDGDLIEVREENDR